MNERLRRLLDERATAWQQAQDIRDRVQRDSNRDLTTEEDETYSRALDDVDRLSRDIQREERADRLAEVDYRQVRASGEDTSGSEGSEDGENRDAAYSRAFGAYLRYGAAELSAEERAVLSPGRVDARELRAQGVATGAAGGFTVPTEFVTRMTERMKAYGGILRYAEVLTTENGDPMEWPTNDDTGNEGALLAENVAAAELDFTLGTKPLGAYMFTSKLTRASIQLLQDSAFNVDTWLPARQGVRLGRAMAGYLATGTGTSQPQGITVGLSSGVTAAAVAAVTLNELIDLEYSVDAAYREGGNCRFIANEAIFKGLRKLVDDNQRPLWEPSLQIGQSDTFLGYPVAVDNKLPAPAAGTIPLVFGDISEAFVVRLVRNPIVLRLTERYAELLQVGFLTFQRMDSVANDTAAAKTLTMAAS